MNDLLWKNFNAGEREEYIEFLKIFGALSGLFKDNIEGSNARKPYLYYRNHEQLFARVFNVEDLTRHDSAFDAVAKIGKERIGVGLKTWIHTKDKTFQKVAEFNKLSPTNIQPLISAGETQRVIEEVSRLRNDRIELDKRQYATSKDVYHYITRDDNVMKIAESPYELVQLDSLKLKEHKKGTYSFTDGLNNYKFYTSKSVLLKEFDASESKILQQIPIIQFNDPFELINSINLSVQEVQKPEEVIYLSIYSDSSFKVEEKSGFNAWNGASKNKGTSILRPDFEAYIPIPKWIHFVFPGFFGFDALNDDERNNSEAFKLYLPDGRDFSAIVTQSSGKSLQTNPQNVLGKWILHDVLGLQARELLTMKRLNELGVDSLKITKINNGNFKIELAETFAYEKWKSENYEKIKKAAEEMNFRAPKLRSEYLEEIL
ncbi:NgoFVII family restriction endonuclease [Niallia taxi]|nr:restriction endonuclease PLD domain-containing protein [Niallia taxi]MDE5052476.1 NgoFVII family restriction endonuclease [Niallia taxi]